MTLASEASVSGLWKLLPGVRPPERASFLFFLSLSGLIFFAQTIGLVTAEALFLARVGVAHLPLAFVLASGVAVAGSLAYAGVVGRRRNDLLFVQLLLLAAGMLLLLGLAVRGGLFWAPFALLCVYYLAQAVFLNHFWTFAGDYFDILATKRLFPLFQIGCARRRDDRCGRATRVSGDPYLRLGCRACACGGPGGKHAFEATALVPRRARRAG
jgi:ATP/ADP translocase